MRFACFPGKVIVLPREVESPLVEVTSPLISYIASISHTLPFELSDLVSQLARLPLPFSHSRPIRSERPLLPYSLLSVSLLPLLLLSLHLGRRNAILAAPRGVSLDLRVRPWVSDDAVGNSPGVHRELAKGIRSLPGWCKGVHRKKIETRRKIVKGSRKACQELERS
ncbi:hypothetical protein B296_00027871 [Ensete ventricosum]|uniref:Uncharacterized protein n=1 Tax=Ensete ventricosum TaxID=4639 RepID=A0A426YFQ8_ENSVE|nr:hypothetical protein B296_00027871 [Ensete ventricosum]